MKKKLTKRMLLGVLAAAMFGVSANDAEAQTLTNTGAGTYNATCGAVIRLKAGGTNAAITTNGTVPIGTSAASAIPGVVEYTRADANGQTVKPYYYNQLILSGANAKTVPTGIFVLGTQCPTFLTGYDQLNTYPYFITGAGVVTYEDGGTFNYAGTTDQNIFPDEYQTIAVTGTGNAVVPAGLIVEAENVTSDADAPILVNGTLNLTTGVSDINGNITVADAGTLTTGAGNVTIDGDLASTGGTITTGGGTVGLTGDVDLSGDGVFTTGAGAVTFTAAGTLDLTGTAAINTGAGDVTANGPVTTADGTTITVGGLGDLTFGGTLDLAGDLVVPDGSSGTGPRIVNTDGPTTIATTGTITLGATSIFNISNSITNGGTGTNLAFDCGSFVNYDGGVQTIMPTVSTNPYGNLSLSGVGAKTGGTASYGSDISICKNFSLAGGNLDMYKGGVSSGTLIMTDATVDPTYTALVEVVGAMQRTTSTDAETYTFNNSATSIALGAAATNPTSMTLNVRPGETAAINNYQAGKDVRRKVNLSYAPSTNAFDMTAQVGYRFEEGPLAGGLWDATYSQTSVRQYEAIPANREKIGTGETPTRGPAAAGANFGFVSLANIGSTSSAAFPNGIGDFASGNDLVLSAGPTTFYSIADGRWTNPNTWDEGTLPTAIDNVELRNTVFAGIDAPFAGVVNGSGTDNVGANNTRSELDAYPGGVAQANMITIANKADFPTRNPAFILGNEDNGAGFVFKTAQLTGNTLVNTNTAASGAPFDPATGIAAKATFAANPGFSGIWVTPWNTGTAPGTPALQTNQIENAGTLNNQGIIEIGN